MKLTRVSVACFLVSTCGIIILSQGVSFARWSEFHPISHYINFHAILISAAGLGLFSAGIIFYSLIKRIETLESIINQTKGGK